MPGQADERDGSGGSRPARSRPPQPRPPQPPASVAPSSGFLCGRVLGGRYRIGALLGAGAMGRVYRAQHIDLGRPCAVKVIRPQPTAEDGEDARARFRIEALAAARLDHPNVLRVLDFGHEPDGDLHYLVTEQLDGADLAETLAAEGPLPAARIARIGRGICAALQHAHDRGVIHRDIKPENVLVVRAEGDDGQAREEVKLLDFGTALIAGENGEAAPEGVVWGTPAYMSPEQTAGAVVDGRTDLYALGVLLFELATGRLPFDRGTAGALAAAHASTPPPRPSAIVPDVDRGLEAVILSCLRKRPSDRPRAARDVRAALGAVLARVENEAPPPSAPASVPSSWPSFARVARWAASIAGIGAAVVVWAQTYERAADPRAIVARPEVDPPPAAAAAASPARWQPIAPADRDAGPPGEEATPATPGTGKP